MMRRMIVGVGLSLLLVSLVASTCFAYMGKPQWPDEFTMSSRSLEH